MTNEVQQTAAHTPGPWTAVEINHDLRRWQIVRFDGRHVAHYVTDIAPAYGTGDDEDEANARLIAAAPVMLEALEDLCDLRLPTGERIAYCCGTDSPDDGRLPLNHSEDCAAGAAIRAARGEGD